MANVKHFGFAGTATGLTIYCLIGREKDGATLDRTDMTFKIASALPDNPLTEATAAGVATQVYTFTDSTVAWDDGWYTVVVYLQAGAGAAWNTDNILATATLFVYHDEITERPYSFTSEV